MGKQSERGMRRVVFWDFDGTLAQRDGLFAGALLDALIRVAPAHELSRDDVRPGLRSGFPWHTPEVTTPPLTPAEWWARLHPVFANAYVVAGVDPETASAAADLVGAEFYRPDAWTAVASAHDALAVTREAGYENVILSNHGPELAELVDFLGFGPLVSRTITSASVGIEKPNPALFAHALEISDAGTDVWMVGDNPIADVQGARQAGIRAILADGAYSDAIGVTISEAAREIAEISAIDQRR